MHIQVAESSRRPEVHSFFKVPTPKRARGELSRDDKARIRSKISKLVTSACECVHA